jgi:hypothetical protein
MRQPVIFTDSAAMLPSQIVRAEEQSVLPFSSLPELGDYTFLPTDSSRLFFDPDTTLNTSLQSLSNFYPGNPISSATVVQTLFFLLFLLCFLLFAFFYRREGSSFTGNFRSMFTTFRPPLIIRKEQVTITEAWGELFLFFQTMLITSILIFHALWDYGISSYMASEQLIAFTLILTNITLLAGVKIIAYRIIGTFFLPVDMKNWVTQYTRLIELIGLILFLPAICFLFLPEFKQLMLVLFAVVFILSRLVIIIELLNIFVKNKIGWFYFFVYLCGTEIAPWLLFYKGVLSMINIAGINII